MRTIKDIEKIQDQLKARKPLWICLDHSVVSNMAIGWIINLAKNSLIGEPSELDLKNHEFMVVEQDGKRGNL